MSKRAFFLLVVLLTPALAFGSVESTLMSIQDRLTGTILPIVSMIGLVFAGFSFISGNPNAKLHAFYASVGAVIGFSASSIVALLRSLAN